MCIYIYIYVYMYVCVIDTLNEGLTALSLGVLNLGSLNKCCSRQKKSESDQIINFM